MKKSLLFLTLFALSVTLFSQTNTWTGAGTDTNWSNVANWSLNAVPTAANDVVIPTGKTVNLNVAGTTKSIVVQGNSTLNINNTLSFTNASSFATNTTANWSSASINGDGTLTNNGTINMIGGTKSYGGATVINNAGTINYNLGSGDLYMYDTSTINNQANGIIDIKTDVYAFYPGDGNTPKLTNAGLIRKTGGANTAYISTNMVNSGTISVSSGTLVLDIREKILNGGVYTATAGNIMYWNALMNVSGTLTGTIEGNVYWNNIVRVATTATFNFSGSNALSLISAQLNGDGTLTNIGMLNFVGGTKSMGGSTVLNNTGTMTFNSGAGDFYLYETARINNQSGGIIDLKADNYAFYPGDSGITVLNNAGTIRKTAGSTTTYISIDMINTGTVTVNAGTLSFDSRQKTLNGGVYNVSSGSFLNWNSTINASNTLTGAINGTLFWNNTVVVANAATFDFSGSSGISMANASLNGDGVLTNAGIFNFVGGTKNFGGATVFNNQGTMTYREGAGDFYMYDTTIFNNEATGIFDIKSAAYLFYPGNVGGQMVNNMGLFKKSENSTVTYITEPFVNSGTIDASSGTLYFTNGYNLTNTVDGIIKGTATVTLPSDANFTNNGTCAPGGSPGTLTMNGNFKSSTTSVLDVELNGLVQGTQYDLLAITGTNVIFDGDVNVSLGFEAAVGDSFTIATVSGTIATKSLTSPTTTEFNGFLYSFNITYPNDKAVKLTITSKVDIQAPTVVTQNVTLQLNAAGNATLTASQVNNGSSDNGTSNANLVYSLSKSNFNCSNLGTNTVTLTVTDEAGNSASADAIITVEDSINPTVVTQNVTVQLDASGNATITADQINNGSADNCSIASLSVDVAAFTCSDLGANTVSLTVEDSSGNTASASATVTVEDSIVPVITACPGDTSATGDTDFTIPNYYDTNQVTATDNCAVATVAQVPSPGTIVGAGITAVSVMVSDASGNEAVCSFNLDVALGINDYELSDSNIQMYPNPVKSLLTIQNSNRLELDNAQIIDITGKVISTFDLSNMGLTKDISLDNYASGLYLVKINSVNGSITKRIIKE